ncbi:FAD-dependent oxidoreductase [Streptomyces hygroscopicus]|uniref:FAD-dependent oxidoreductase n=1 Tax=Streptomyces hygroscopicus TaxID=1912 RepID=UPI00099E7892|nr:FAD-dependent oxidoreductase [Streptomyces hygroscopicus]GLV76300.1 hypothetical protein Shyhy02_43000 [Streptomyces hygroscopicus subsp. hygroscopicus]
MPSYRVAGGNQRLAVEMSRALGERVHCYEVVRSVENIDDGPGAAVVRTSSGEHLFDHVVVALPLTVLTGGHVYVPTSDARDEALARLRQGHAAKLHVPLRSTPSTSAVLSLPGRFWTWTAVDECRPRRCPRRVPPNRRPNRRGAPGRYPLMTTTASCSQATTRRNPARFPPLVNLAHVPGHWADGSPRGADDVFGVGNPADGSALAWVNEGTPADTCGAVDAAHRAFPGWAAPRLAPAVRCRPGPTG